MSKACPPIHVAMRIYVLSCLLLATTNYVIADERAMATLLVTEVEAIERASSQSLLVPNSIVGIDREYLQIFPIETQAMNAWSVSKVLKRQSANKSKTYFFGDEGSFVTVYAPAGQDSKLSEVVGFLLVKNGNGTVKEAIRFGGRLIERRAFESVKRQVRRIRESRITESVFGSEPDLLSELLEAEVAKDQSVASPK